MHVFGTRVPRRLGVARSASSPKAAQALGCSFTLGLRISFGRVSCMARAASVPGLWTLGFLLLCGVCVWVRVAVCGGLATPPVLAGVLDGCVWARFVVLSLLCRLFLVFVVWLRFQPAYGTCVVACTLRLPPPFSVPVCGVRVRAGVWVLAAPRLSLGGCWGVCVLVRPSRVVSCTSWLGLLFGGACLCARPDCSPPFLARVRCVGVRAGPGSRLYPALLGWVVGVCFLRFFFCVSWLGFVVSVAGCPCPWSCGPCPPIPFLSGWAAGSFFFMFQRGVCLHVSVSLFSVGRCSWLGVAGFGWPVPVCLFGGPVFGAFWVGGLAASCGVGGRCGGCGLFSLPPAPPPPVLFFVGGGLPVPPSAFPELAMHWPAFSVVFRAAVGACVLLGRVSAPWVGWALYTLGSAPPPAGLGPGSAGRAGAPGSCVWLWVKGLGLSVFLLLCGAGFNLLGGSPLLLLGARWPRVWSAVPVCGVLVRRLPGCAVACFG